MTDSQPGTPAVPALPVGAAFDREAVRQIVLMAIGKGWNNQDHPAAERVTEAVWPLLGHAQEAAAGSYEGMRLWMTDCGELVAKHRDRAEAAERALAGVRGLLDAWEARYPAGGGMPEDLIADLRAIIGGGENGHDDGQPAAPGELCGCRCKNPKGKCGCCDESLSDWYAAMDDGSDPDA